MLVEGMSIPAKMPFRANNAANGSSIIRIGAKALLQT